MKNPAFFDAVARITLHDPLAELLGAAENGLIEYGYADAVKLAGHSCPTVAGAYQMTLKGLGRLYPEGAAGCRSNSARRNPRASPASSPPWPAC